MRVETSHRDLPLVGRQVVAEQKMFWRNPAAAGFTIIFPLFFLIIFSLLNGTGDIAPPSGIVVRFTSYYIAGIIVFAAVSACFTNLAINLTMRRDDGTLKRKRSTPLPTWALFAGLLGSQLIVTVLMALFTTALSMAFFHVRLPQHLLEFRRRGAAERGHALLARRGHHRAHPQPGRGPGRRQHHRLPAAVPVGAVLPGGQGHAPRHRAVAAAGAGCSTPSSTRSPRRCGTARRCAGAARPCCTRRGRWPPTSP